MSDVRKFLGVLQDQAVSGQVHVTHAGDVIDGCIRIERVKKGRSKEPAIVLWADELEAIIHVFNEWKKENNL